MMLTCSLNPDVDSSFGWVRHTIPTKGNSRTASRNNTPTSCYIHTKYNLVHPSPQSIELNLSSGVRPSNPNPPNLAHLLFTCFVCAAINLLGKFPWQNGYVQDSSSRRECVRGCTPEKKHTWIACSQTKGEVESEASLLFVENISKGIAQGVIFVSEGECGRAGIHFRSNLHRCSHSFVSGSLRLCLRPYLSFAFQPWGKQCRNPRTIPQRAWWFWYRIYLLFPASTWYKHISGGYTG